ncbi:MAG: glutamine-hydrolyzing GMP synthase [bacterium]|nr:glutamine-hydrolyzing GMP synthase [bacterium]
MKNKSSRSKQKNTVLVLDYGSQVAKLLADCARISGVYSEIVPFDLSAEEIKKKNPIGLIISGGPDSVYRQNAPAPDKKIFELGLPILGVCYGHQLIAHLLGGEVSKGEKGEYGHRELSTGRAKGTPLEKSGRIINVWMSHRDQVIKLPRGFEAIAKSQTCPVAAMINRKRKIVGLQFHPEVEHTAGGLEMIKYFLLNICGASGKWKMASFKTEAIAQVRKHVCKQGNVLGAVSGGVDSTTLAVLLNQAIGKRFTAVFVDNGLLRLNERPEVIKTLKRAGVNLKVVDAVEIFLKKLKGVTDPEKKRKIIGRLFIEIFKREARRLEKNKKIKIKFLAQGTLYPDVIESGSGQASTIKSHHNVGGLPEKLGFDLIEPFRNIFKSEVRALARELNLPKIIWGRHPFPGPALAIRIKGEVTRKKLEILRAADAIFMEELIKADRYYNIGQAFAVLTSDKSVGVVGDDRSYNYVLALRAVDTSVFMTASVSNLPHEFLCRVSERITNEVKGVGRVVYDYTSKPPGTIEWE